jgi:fatty acid desaturase
MRTSKVRYSSNLLNGLLFFFHVVSDVTHQDVMYVYRDWCLGRRTAWNALIETMVLLSFSLPLLVWNWKTWLILWHVPRFLCSYLIVSVNYLQHDGCDTEPENEAEAKAQLAAGSINYARNFVGSLINFWTFNNGFHSMHHIKPALHWSQLKEHHEKEIVPIIHPNLLQPDMGKYMFEALILPGERVRFDGKPVILPEDDKDEPWF